MEIKYNIAKDNLYIYLYGELDEYSAQGARQTLDNLLDANINTKKVVFNFANMSFMDSTGIGVLIGRYKKLKKIGIPVFIQSPGTNIEKILQLSGLYEVMPKI